MPRRLATALLPLAALTIGAAGASEPDWIAEDPAGITGPATVPVGEAAMTFGFAQTQARSGRARGTSLGAVEAEAGIAPRLDLRFVQALGYGRTGARLDESEAPAWGGLGGTAGPGQGVDAGGIVTCAAGGFNARARSSRRCKSSRNGAGLALAASRLAMNT